MATNDLLNQIAENYQKLTRAEKKVADFVLANPQRALRASITDLAEQCEVGDTSVFRFCRTLRLKGYQDFRVSLAMSTNYNEAMDAQTGDSLLQQHAESIEQVVTGVQEAYIAAVQDATQSLQNHAIQAAVELLLGAGSIHLYGVGSSGITALELQNKLLRITPNVSYHYDTHEQITSSALLNQTCLAIIFSNSGITKDCIDIAKLAHTGGAKIIFVTKFSKTPASQFSDVVLLSGAVEGPMQGGSIAGKIAQLFLIDILYAEYFRRLGEIATTNKRCTSQCIAEKML